MLALAKEDRDANWFTSFGPVKAEEDPRLPTARFPREKEKRKQTDLFWARHPLWEEIKVARSALFVAPPKSGRTAFIWMGRYERRFWGLSPALSLYLPLDGPPDKEVLLHSLRNALGESLLCALAEDPFWLLDAPSDYQARLCSFLINWAGDPVELFHRMAIRGLREGDPDVRLLRELLLQYSSSSKDLLGEPEVLSLLEMARETLGEAARYRLRDPTFSTFLWVDVKGEKGPGWVRLLQGWERLRQTAHLKIFTPQDCPFEPRFYLEWREKDIRNLLEHRWEKVKLDESAWETIRKILMQVSTPPEGWEDIEWNTMKGHLEDSWEGLREWLVQRAERSPSRLILEGNRLLETYGRALK
ncbi:MAG TPA: hypothetical protein ENK08_05405 [Chloroflexi bacterium]|nr:hypothetical protein [Chloroflexota bacterium]